MKRIINKFKLEWAYYSGRFCEPPDFLSLIVTFKCNFKCRTCDIWKKEERQELAPEAWRRSLAGFKEVFAPGTFVEINGGEPLLRPELVFDLISELKKYFNTVALNSNGSTITARILAKLEEAGLDLLKISLYSLNPQTHNELRGCPEAFALAKNAIELAGSSKIRIEAGVLITKKNIRELPALLNYLQTLRAAIILQPLDENIESSQTKTMANNLFSPDLWPEAEEVNKFFEWLGNQKINIKNSPQNLEAIREYYLKPESVLKFRCFAGQRNTVIYPNGDVALCFKRNVVGNITQGSLRNILESATEERRGIRKCRKYCRIVGCNFSRGWRELIKF